MLVCACVCPCLFLVKNNSRQEKCKLSFVIYTWVSLSFLIGEYETQEESLRALEGTKWKQPKVAGPLESTLPTSQFSFSLSMQCSRFQFTRSLLLLHIYLKPDPSVSGSHWLLHLGRFKDLGQSCLVYKHSYIFLPSLSFSCFLSCFT